MELNILMPRNEERGYPGSVAKSRESNRLAETDKKLLRDARGTVSINREDDTDFLGASGKSNGLVETKRQIHREPENRGVQLRFSRSLEKLEESARAIRNDLFQFPYFSITRASGTLNSITDLKRK